MGRPTRSQSACRDAVLVKASSESTDARIAKAPDVHPGLLRFRITFDLCNDQMTAPAAQAPLEARVLP